MTGRRRRGGVAREHRGARRAPRTRPRPRGRRAAGTFPERSTRDRPSTRTASRPPQPPRRRLSRRPPRAPRAKASRRRRVQRRPVSQTLSGRNLIWRRTQEEDEEEDESSSSESDASSSSSSSSPSSSSSRRALPRRRLPRRPLPKRSLVLFVLVVPLPALERLRRASRTPRRPPFRPAEPLVRVPQRRQLAVSHRADHASRLRAPRAVQHVGDHAARLGQVDHAVVVHGRLAILQHLAVVSHAADDAVVRFRLQPFLRAAAGRALAAARAAGRERAETLGGSRVGGSARAREGRRRRAPPSPSNPRPPRAVYARRSLFAATAAGAGGHRTARARAHDDRGRRRLRAGEWRGRHAGGETG